MYGETQIRVKAKGTQWNCTAFIFGNREVEKESGFDGVYVGMIVWNHWNGPIFLHDTPNGAPWYAFHRAGVENPPPELYKAWEWLLTHSEAINGTSKTLLYVNKHIEVLI